MPPCAVDARSRNPLYYYIIFSTSPLLLSISLFIYNYILISGIHKLNRRRGCLHFLALYAFCNKGSIEGTNPSEMYDLCLCMYHISWTGFVDLTREEGLHHYEKKFWKLYLLMTDFDCCPEVLLCCWLNIELLPFFQVRASPKPQTVLHYRCTHMKDSNPREAKKFKATNPYRQCLGIQQ